MVGKQFLMKMGDNLYTKLDKIIDELTAQLLNHYDSDNKIIIEDQKRKIDSAVISIINTASHPI